MIPSVKRTRLAAVMASVVALGACDRGRGLDLEVTPVRPEGPWRSALQGSTEGVAWQLWVASGTHGGLCASTETSPPLGTGVSIQRGSDGSGSTGPPSESPVHRGRRANCVPRPHSTEREALYVLDVDSVAQDGPGPHFAAAVVTPQATDVVAVFSDGSTQPLQPESGFVVLVWRDERRLHFVDMRLPDWAGPTRCGGSDDRTLLDELGASSCYSKDA